MPLTRTTASAKLQAPPVQKKKAIALSHISSNQHQQLCDETRAQYELLLARQETSHERTLQAAHSKLRLVLSSHIPLTEHEKSLFNESEAHRREREHQARAHARDLQQLEQKWQQQWQKRERELVARFDADKSLLLDLLPPLELERNDALRLLKEQEIDQLTWSRELHEAHRARELAEARFAEACKHILTLKVYVKRLEPQSDRVEEEKQKAKQKAKQLDAKLQQATLQIVELKGESTKVIGVLESSMSHVQEALREEKERHVALQSDVSELRAHRHELETALAELRTTEQLAIGIRDAEQAQSAKELAALQAALASQRAKVQQLRQKAEELEQRACQAELRKQELETKLAMLTHATGERESRWRRQKQELRAKAGQLKSAVRQLQLQQQERQHDEQLAGLLFGSDVA